MSDLKHQIKLETQSGIQTANALTPENKLSLPQKLSVGLTGGDAVYDFFSNNTQAMNQIWQTIATAGDSAWIDGETADGNPIQFLKDGTNYLEVGGLLHDQDTVRNGTGNTSDYKQVGSAYVTLTTDQGASQMLVMNIQYAGMGIAGLGLTSPILKFLKPLVKATVKFLRGLCVRAYNRYQNGGSNPDDAEDDVRTDADGSAADAGDAAADVGGDSAGGIFANVSVSVMETVGIVVAVGAIAVTIILALLEKQMTSWVKFFNATGTDIQYGIGYATGDTGVQIAPAAVGSTIMVNKVAIPAAPPGIITSQEAMTRSDATVINSNVLKGIGYVLEAKASGDFPGFRVRIDIPSDGKNTLWVGMCDTDAESVWNDEDGSADETMSAESGIYKLQVATNALDGKSPSPLNAEDGYNYEYLVVLTDGSIPIGPEISGEQQVKTRAVA